jgi:hypothetical protein
MTTDKHVDPAAAAPTVDAEEDPDAVDIPEGAMRFELDASEIEDAIAAPSLEVRGCGSPPWPTGFYCLFFAHDIPAPLPGVSPSSLIQAVLCHTAADMQGMHTGDLSSQGRLS